MKRTIIVKPIFMVILSIFMLPLNSCIHARTKQRLPEDGSSRVDNGTLIVMAYPNLIVKSVGSFSSKLYPLIGIGSKDRTRAGHACMILVKDDSSTFEYIDNGRYISPEGFSRVRSADTDFETKVEVEAQWHDGKIANIEELLRWLYDHPEKTHGGNDLYASVFSLGSVCVRWPIELSF